MNDDFDQIFAKVKEITENLFESCTYSVVESKEAKTDEEDEVLDGFDDVKRVVFYVMVSEGEESEDEEEDIVEKVIGLQGQWNKSVLESIGRADSKYFSLSIRQIS